MCVFFLLSQQSDWLKMRENLEFVFRENVWCVAHIEIFSGTGIFDAMNTPTTLSTTITSTTSTSLTTITTTTRSIRGIYN